MNEELDARLTALEFVVMTILASVDPDSRARLREAFDSNMSRFREIGLMTHAPDAYLSALGVQHEHWLSRFSEASRDAATPP